MKKIISSLFIVAGLFVLLGYAGVVSASTTPKLFMDGKQLVTDVDPIIKQGTTLVPLAVISRDLGYEVKWDNKAQQATVLDKETSIKLTIGQKVGYVNDKSYELSQAPSLVKNRTMVPIRFVSEVLGLKVEWKQKTFEVLLTSPVKPTPTPTPTLPPTPTPTPAVQEATVTGVVLSEEGNLHIGYTGTLGDPKVMLLPADANNPARLVVDLNNTGYTYELANSFIKGQTEVTLNGYASMTGYRFSQFSSNPLVARIVVLLNDGVNYQVSRSSSEVLISFNGEVHEQPSDPSGTSPTPTPTPTPPATGDSVYHIVLDAGHGGKDPGASNESLGLMEKTFTLSLTLKLKQQLEQNSKVKVHLTRSDDTYPELSERVAFAQNIPGVGKNADVFISIHANSFKTNPAVNGTETYYYKENSKQLAQTVHSAMINSLGLADRKVKTAGFKVIKETTMPAVLLEVGFLSNTSDAKVLFDEEKQNKLAKDLAASLFQYLNV